MKTIAALVLFPLLAALALPASREAGAVLVTLSFGANLLVSSWLLNRSCRARPFSLDVVHRTFLYAFLTAIPFLQWRMGAMPLATRLWISDGDLLAANAILLLWMLTYAAVHDLWLTRRPAPQRPARPVNDRFEAVWAFAMGVLALAYLESRGMAGLSTRKAIETKVEFASTTDMLIVGVFVRAIPYAALGALALAAKRLRSLGIYLMLAILTAATLVVTSPLAAARFWSAAIAIAFTCWLLIWNARSAHILVFCILGGLVVGLPLLELGRVATELRDISEIALPDWRLVVASGDFDAYAMILATREYARTAGITWGMQALGVALFWVPRSLWPTKPIGSGAEVAEFLRLPHTNVSSPLQAEGLINLGYPGVVVFAVLFAAVIAGVDRHYWSMSRQHGAPAQVVYPFLVGMTFFLSRGDLLSGVAYVSGIIAAALVVTMSPVGTLRSLWRPHGEPHSARTRPHRPSG